MDQQLSDVFRNIRRVEQEIQTLRRQKSRLPWFTAIFSDLAIQETEERCRTTMEALNRATLNRQSAVDRITQATTFLEGSRACCIDSTAKITYLAGSLSINTCLSIKSYTLMFNVNQNSWMVKYMKRIRVELYIERAHYLSLVSAVTEATQGLGSP
ncbi:hypothetical protein U1Q18_024626 [Sarracenia purpurea var. burkii]